MADKNKFDFILNNVKTEDLIDGLRLSVFPNGFKGGLLINGSMLGGSYFAENPVTAGALSSMLSRGTKRKSKDKIQEVFDQAGATYRFSTDKLRLNFSLTCLKDDVNKLLPLLVEMLVEPAFLKSEFEISKKHIIANLLQLKDNTNHMAMTLFRKNLFKKDSPDYYYSPDELLSYAKKLSLNDVKKFHKELGLGSLLISVVGDFDTKNIKNLIKSEFKRMPCSKLKLPESKPSAKDKPNISEFYMADKKNIDYITGVKLPINTEDRDYYPSSMATLILGGAGFTSRLMNEVRNKQGLTYGIYSRIYRADDSLPGLFLISATFAPSLLGKGEKVLMEELTKFYNGGITEEELSARKKMCLGSISIGNETLGGASASIMSILKSGKIPEESIVEEVKNIEKMTVSEVNDVIKKYLNPKDFSVSKAGTFSK